jgi:hypothetical protein
MPFFTNRPKCKNSKELIKIRHYKGGHLSKKKAATCAALVVVWLPVSAVD